MLKSIGGYRKSISRIAKIVKKLKIDAVMSLSKPFSDKPDQYHRLRLFLKPEEIKKDYSGFS